MAGRGIGGRLLISPDLEPLNFGGLVLRSGSGGTTAASFPLGRKGFGANIFCLLSSTGGFAGRPGCFLSKELLGGHFCVPVETGGGSSVLPLENIFIRSLTLFPPAPGPLSLSCGLLPGSLGAVSAGASNFLLNFGDFGGCFCINGLLAIDFCCDGNSGLGSLIS